MKSDFLSAITQLAAERNLPRELVVSVVESALASAFKKDNLANANLSVKIHPATGEIHTYVVKQVVEAPTDPVTELSLQEAQRHKKDAKVGETIEIETSSAHAGRIIAQTAKQVILQRLREAEQDLVYSEFGSKVNDLVSGVIQRMDGRNMVVDLGRAEALLPPSEQVPTERYRPGQRMRFYLLEVSKGAKGVQVLLSRTHRDLVKRLLELEVPEIHSGAIEVRAIAREPGLRTKIAVLARQANIDAVGSCVGLRGMRIQNIVNELQGEKIDVIEWHRDPATLLARALSPAQVVRVQLKEKDGTALVVVPDRQLSLAIGREGQNARLAAKLTGWHIDIKSASQVEEEKAPEVPVEAAVPEPREDLELAPAAVAPEPGPQAGTPVVEVPAEVEAELPQEIPLVEKEEPQPVAVAQASPEGPQQAAAAPSRQPQIRFAEDILKSRPQSKKDKARREGDEGKAKRAKPKRVYLEDSEDMEEFEKLLD